ncbi:MAG TPA: hypothetical protein VM492_16500 [Sumerlaeia bacterium]|nr:hypothetical protein [Sumerlaeia bacterium]
MNPKNHNPLACGPFIQIPGPNPVLTPGEKGAWDDSVLESADAFKDFGTYYWYYHACGQSKGYRLGVATAPRPLGPFTKHGDAPVLDLGPEGSWDDQHVACAMVLKEGLDRYLMWYSGYGSSAEHRKWSIGLATASHPLGPWMKSEKNPILEDFGYVGGVVKAGGKYHLYTAHPIGSTGDDYSPMALATADAPEGPWANYEGNPVLKQGEWGEWDDGGFSEAEVLYHNGVFHLFYGGAKLYDPRTLTRESIGYAHSLDGRRFVKYGRNPVATREANPNAAAFAEVHAIIEMPFIYLYHTLRYKEPWRPSDAGKRPGVEDLGIQVLVTQRPFSIDAPALSRKALGAGETTSWDEAPPLALAHVTRAALTVECRFGDRAKGGLRLHVRSSADGLAYDTVDLATLECEAAPGGILRRTFPLEPAVRFIKVAVENADGLESVSDVKVTASLGG